MAEDAEEEVPARQAYQIQINVTVHDLDLLKAYALGRALASGLSEAEFNEGEHDAPEDNITYWLGWAFDSGTPPNCGFDIEDSGCVFEGSVP